MRKRGGGFTIVELLIVIVVIGILSAITLVVYNGVQSRAQNTRLLSAFDLYEKAIGMYMVDNSGEVPPSGMQYGQPLTVCLGDAYPAKDGFAANQCGYRQGMPGAAPTMVSSSVNTALKQYANALPVVDTNTYSSGGTYPQHTRGIMYTSTPDYAGVGARGYLFYYMKGDGVCGRGTKTPVGDMTMCSLSFQ